MFSKGIMVYQFTFTTMDALAMGVLLAIIEKENKTTFEFNTTFKLITFGFGLVLALIWFYFNGEGSTLIQAFKYTILSGFYFGIIGWSLSSAQSSFGNKILNSVPLNFAGKISFGLYVFHPLVLSWFQGLGIFELDIVNQYCPVVIKRESIG
jgi:peptidoglycan/LPS O-acetylase OafA/YrhL